MAWKAMDPLSAVIDDSSSDPDAEEDNSVVRGAVVSQRKRAAKGGLDCKKVKLDFDALSRHGYSGGPSIFHVPAPKQGVGDKNWSWSNGKRESEGQQEKESIEERELSREIVNQKTMKMATAALAESAFANRQKRETIAEQKALSFSQKEKRKRDLGQTSRGKNYVEEEKRLLRDSGVYSGFDT